MTARDLHGILTAAQEAGLQRFVFHATHLHNHLANFYKHISNP